LSCFFLWQVKVKVVTKVNVEDVELSVVDKEQNIKSKTVRWSFTNLFSCTPFSLLVNFGYWKISCKSERRMGTNVARVHVHVKRFVYECTWRNQMSLGYSDREITYKLPSSLTTWQGSTSFIFGCVFYQNQIQSINQSIFIVHYMYLQNSKVVLQFDLPESKYLCRVQCNAIKLQVYILCF